MSLALYRRYRPGTFAEVVGQEHVTEPLRTALSAGRINHAYLFSGPRGCGKTSSARIMARSLNCEQGPTPDPCGVCESCIALAPNGPGSLDVTEMDAASHNGVDDARELRDRAHFAPVSSRYRVFIIDEAHMVTTAAFNALLKVVEEPPEHLIFVFATTEPDKVLPTIRSRTHHYPFRLLPPSTLRGLLERICAEEGVSVEPAVYPLVVRAGGGSARDSLSVLDQLLAGADHQGVTYARAVGLLGVTDVAILDDVVDALGAQDGAAVFGAVDRLVEAGHDPRRFAADLLQRLRDLILVQAVPDAAEKNLVDVPADELERMVDQAQRLGPAALARHAELVHTALTEMRGATAPRLLLELVCARMLLPAASASDAALVQRLEGVERRLQAGATAGAGGPLAPGAGPAVPEEGGEPRFRRPSQRREDDGAPAPATRSGDGEHAPPADAPPADVQPADALDATVQPPTDRPTATVEAPRAPERRPREDAPAAPERPAPPRPAPEPAAPAAAEEPAPAAAAPGAMDAAGLRRVWSEVMNAVRESSKPTHALLLNATVAAVEGTTVTLAMPTPPLAKQLSQPNRAGHVTTALGRVLSGEWALRAVDAEGHQPGGAGPAGDGRGRGGPAPAAPSRAQSPSRGSSPQGQPAAQGAGAQRGAREPSGSSERSADPEPGAPAGRPQFQRPSARQAGGAERAAGGRPPEPPAGRGAPRPAAAPADIPPPPEPPDEEEVTEEDMYAEAHADPGSGEAVTRRDPDDIVMELLTQQLGARRVDGGR
ncbi:DNA polymerase III subunit gamma and tau [Actinomycetospora sp. TBRC 11914]|uniref:DNA polymerase III subunit gamma and tau n=1 Tax=Actinomycetospora sp. TBRC 11914 TaxID=2729387 RepID=UPI00145E4461|nr:DNA polymerase III subunit gamma and tau [Actinomycetospora sp. TBRC 11914]NMO92158.1 DNA polymerase III subunit gamma and tau [Actinomycetospora sp. TBRC 11914]